MFEIHCIISGKVQMVGFRDYVQNSADALKVTGWVKNLPDGTVEVLAQGDRETLKEFIEYMHEGSSLAEVTGVAIDWSTVKDKCEEFGVRYDT